MYLADNSKFIITLTWSLNLWWVIHRLPVMFLISSHIIFQTQSQLQHLSNEHSQGTAISKSNLFPRSRLFNILSICCNKADRHCHDVLIVSMLGLAAITSWQPASHRKQQPTASQVNDKDQRLYRKARSRSLFEFVPLINSGISLARDKGTYLKVFLCLRKLLYPYHCDTQPGATTTQRTIEDLSFPHDFRRHRSCRLTSSVTFKYFHLCARGLAHAGYRVTGSIDGPGSRLLLCYHARLSGL